MRGPEKDLIKTNQLVATGPGPIVDGTTLIQFTPPTGLYDIDVWLQSSANVAGVNGGSSSAGQQAFTSIDDDTGGNGGRPAVFYAAPVGGMHFSFREHIDGLIMLLSKSMATGTLYAMMRLRRVDEGCDT